MTDEKGGSVEILDAPETVEVQTPTLEDLKDEGFGAQEIKDAETLGMVAKPEAEKPKEQGKAPEAKAEEPKKPTKEEHEAAWKRSQIEEDPAKEAEKLKDFSLNEKKLYHAQKLAYHKQKTAEAERDALAAKLKAAEARLEEVEKKVPVELDEEGNPKPRGEKKSEPTDDEKRAQAQIVARREAEQVEDAKQRYEDFDEVMALTTEILKNPQEMFKGDTFAFSKAKRLYEKFMGLYGQPTERGEYSAADAAYELGQLHPNYKKMDATPAKGEKDGAGPQAETKLDPTKVDKVKEISKRQASASLPSGGGSKRIVSYDKLTVEDAAKMSPEQFDNLPIEVQERLLGKPN